MSARGADRQVEFPASIARLVDLEALRAVSRSHRKLKKLVIPHLRFSEIVNKVAFHHAGYADDPDVESGCLLLYGKTGAGKTVPLKYYARQFPVTRGPGGMIRRVLYLQVPSGADKHSLQRRILRHLGVPLPPRVAQDELTLLLDMHLRLQGVELLVLDETNHLADLRSSQKQYFAADMLKELANFNSCQIVVAGLESSLSVFVNNPQLLRRRDHSFEVKPYAWDDTDDREAFNDFLDEIADNTPFRNPPRLADWSERLSVASWGLVGISSLFLIRATEIAVETASRDLSLLHLASAFDELKPPGTKGNPFAGTSVRFPPEYLALLMEGVDRKSGLRKRAGRDAA